MTRGLVLYLVSLLGSDDFQTREAAQVALAVANEYVDVASHLPGRAADPEVWHRLACLRTQLRPWPMPAAAAALVSRPWREEGAAWPTHWRLWPDGTAFRVEDYRDGSRREKEYSWGLVRGDVLELRSGSGWSVRLRKGGDDQFTGWYSGTRLFMYSWSEGSSP